MGTKSQGQSSWQAIGLALFASLAVFLWMRNTQPAPASAQDVSPVVITDDFQVKAAAAPAPDTSTVSTNADFPNGVWEYYGPFSSTPNIRLEFRDGVCHFKALGAVRENRNIKYTPYKDENGNPQLKLVVRLMPDDIWTTTLVTSHDNGAVVDSLTTWKYKGEILRDKGGQAYLKRIYTN